MVEDFSNHRAEEDRELLPGCKTGVPRTVT